MTGRTTRRAFLAGVAAAVAGPAGRRGQSTDWDTGDNRAGGQPTRTAKPGMRPGATAFASGETLSLPRVEPGPSNPRTTSSYDRHEKGSDERRVARPGEDERWLKVDVRSVNTANRVVRLPLMMNFKRLVGGTAHHPGRDESPQEKYVGGEVPANGNREGSTAFLLPETVEIKDVQVHYGEHRPDGKREALWAP